MSIVSVGVEVGIFDDPEYCNKGEYECRFIRRNPTYAMVNDCVLFDGRINHNYIFNRKCPQCKAAYQKAKGRPMTGCMCGLRDGDSPQLCINDSNPLPDRKPEELCSLIAEGKTKENCGYWKTVYVRGE